MADTVKKNTVVFITEEVTEGTYVAPTLGSQAIQTLADGLEMSPAKELVERNINQGTIGQTAGRPGQRSVTGALPVEFKAGTSGAAPEYGLLLEAALGAKRSVTTEVTAATSDGATGTATRVPLANTDKNKYAVNDIVRVRRTGEEDHISRVVSVVNTDGSVSITLEKALSSGTFDAGDVVSKVTTYYTADSGHKAVSVTKEIEGALVEKAIGCRVSSVSLNNFSTGQIADWGFGFEGLDFDRSLTPTGVTESYDTSTPPLILSASVFVDGSEVEVNEVSISMENTLAFKTATNSPNGRIASRITQRAITGSLNPYKQDDDLTFYTKFENNTTFNLMLYAYNPGATAGEKNEICAIYIPDCIVTELGEADQDGLLQDTVSFTANLAKMFVCFI